MIKFATLKEKCEYYRGMADSKLIPGLPVLMMLDGHCFSRLIKKKFKLPYDDDFIDLMNKTAAHLCHSIQGAKFAYTQSDEISIFIKDNPEADPYFGNRLCKLLSIPAAEASSFFMKEYLKLKLSAGQDIQDILEEAPIFTFDCKAWNVPAENEVFAWFLYRQNDCLRNSKQQFAQTYMSPSQLLGKNTTEQVELCKIKTGQDWERIEDSKKYGRLIYPEIFHRTKTLGPGKTIEFDRSEFTPHSAKSWNKEPEQIKNLIV